VGSFPVFFLLSWKREVKQATAFEPPRWERSNAVASCLVILRVLLVLPIFPLWTRSRQGTGPRRGDALRRTALISETF
ncbi:MAG: hypothetical protein IJO40_02515, partial [Thermoguttaceae bacterium]|nr:hypothetical protein [Thermoguttaceae bacterium]